MGSVVLGLALYFAVVAALAFLSAVFYDGLRDFLRSL